MKNNYFDLFGLYLLKSTVLVAFTGRVSSLLVEFLLYW